MRARRERGRGEQRWKKYEVQEEYVEVGNDGEQSLKFIHIVQFWFVSFVCATLVGIHIWPKEYAVNDTKLFCFFLSRFGEITMH